MVGLGGDTLDLGARLDAPIKGQQRLDDGEAAVLRITLRHQLRLTERALSVARCCGLRGREPDGRGIVTATLGTGLADERPATREIIGVAGHTGERREHRRRQRIAPGDIFEDLPRSRGQIAFGKRRQDLPQRTIRLYIRLREQTEEDLPRIGVPRARQCNIADEPQGFDILRVQHQEALRGCPGRRQVLASLTDLGSAISQGWITRGQCVRAKPLGGGSAIALGETALARTCGAGRWRSHRRWVNARRIDLRGRHLLGKRRCGGEQQHRGGKGGRRSVQKRHCGTTI